MMASGSVPLVPVSPLVKTSEQYKAAYAGATDRLSQAKQATNPRVEVSVLRRLIDDRNVERHRLDTVEQQMEAVEAATAFHWDPDVLARQVAAVDAQLYGRVVLDKQLLCGPLRHSHLVHLVDFHRYLTHSFAHQLIYWSELTPASPVVPTVHPKDNLVAHLVRVAYLLVHVYRDFSGFASIMKALMLPEVRRLRKLWHACPTRTRDLYRDLAQLLSPSRNYTAYHDMLHRKLDLFAGAGAAAAAGMVAVPWVHPHLADIHSIIKEYTAGDRVSASAVLSAPGARKLSAVVAVLELCQHNSTSELPIDEILTKTASDPDARRKSRRMSLKPIQLDGVRSTAIVPPPDLARLAPADAQAYHWLVSRAYLTKDQLIEESIQVEPLAHGEELACDVDEDEVEAAAAAEREQIDDDAPVPATFSVPATPIIARSRRASVDTRDATTPPKPEQQNQPVVTVTDSDDDDNDNDNNGGDAAEQVESKPPAAPEPTTAVASAAALDQDLQNVWSDLKPQEEGAAAGAAGAATGAKSHSVVTSSTQPDSATSKQTKKSRLSPTAPEFVPTGQKSVTANDATGAALSTTAARTAAAAPSSVVVSPGSSLPDPRGLASLAQQPQHEVQADEAAAEHQDDPEEEEEEEWHGYIYHANESETRKGNDSESEKWNGYPSPPPELTTPDRRGSSTPSDEDSEVWKGYHASKMEDVWQQETAAKVQDCDWQGYTLETLNEDELDSSTMMDGEFEKSRQARAKDDVLEAFRRQQHRWAPSHSPNHQQLQS